MTEIALPEKPTDVAAADRLAGLAAAVGTAQARRPPPADSWHPPYCGDLDMRIAADGTWYYAGTPIARRALVELFAGILRKDDERYVLVTPVECLGITVEDAPFVAVAMAASGDRLRFITNIGDEVEAGADHPLRFDLDADGGVRPYIHIRGGLEARLTRSLAIDLLTSAAAVETDGVTAIRSGDSLFAIPSTAPSTAASAVPVTDPELR